MESRPFPVRPTRIFYEMYRDAAPYGGLWGRIKAANPSIFGRGFVNQQLKSLQGNASLRTTVAATQIQASDTPNVLPHTVWANFNCRLNPGDTRQELVEYTLSARSLKYWLSVLAKKTEGTTGISP